MMGVRPFTVQLIGTLAAPSLVLVEYSYVVLTGLLPRRVWPAVAAWVGEPALFIPTRSIAKSPEALTTVIDGLGAPTYDCSLPTGKAWFTVL